MLGVVPAAALASLVGQPPQWVEHPLARLGVIAIGVAIFIGMNLWDRRERRRLLVGEWSARQALNYLAHRSKWGRFELAQLNYIEAVKSGAPAEFRRAAREGEIHVKGRLPNTLESTDIDKNYWMLAKLSDSDPDCSEVISDGNTVPTPRPYSNLRVLRTEMDNSWPSSSLPMRGLVAAFLWLKLKWLFSPLREHLCVLREWMRQLGVLKPLPIFLALAFICAVGAGGFLIGRQSRPSSPPPVVIAGEIKPANVPNRPAVEIELRSPSIVPTSPYDVRPKLEAIDVFRKLFLGDQFGLQFDSDMKLFASATKEIVEGRGAAYRENLKRVQLRINEWLKSLLELRQKNAHFPDLRELLTPLDIQTVLVPLAQFIEIVDAMGDAPNVRVGQIIDPHAEKMRIAYVSFARWRNERIEAANRAERGKK